MNELALFAGNGGGILGGTLLGWRTICAVEINAYCAGRLMQRQNEGHLPPFPIWDDVCSFDGLPWKGLIDVVSGGFPCQDISQANPNALGIDGERSGLWSHMHRIIDEIRPRYAWVENSPMLTLRGLGRVLGDLAGMGYDARWGVFRGNYAGVPQRRARLFIYAHSARSSSEQILHQNPEHVGRDKARLDARSKLNAYSNNKNTRARTMSVLEHEYWSEIFNGRGSRGIDGLADRMERERAVGNGQIPSVVKLAWEVLGSET